MANNTNETVAGKLLSDSFERARTLAADDPELGKRLNEEFDVIYGILNEHLARLRDIEDQLRTARS